MAGEIAVNASGVATAAQETANGATDTLRAAGDLATMSEELQQLVEEAAKAAFAVPDGFDELERRVYDDTALIILRHRA